MFEIHWKYIFYTLSQLKNLYIFSETLFSEIHWKTHHF